MLKPNQVLREKVIEVVAVTRRAGYDDAETSVRYPHNTAPGWRHEVIKCPICEIGNVA